MSSVSAERTLSAGNWLGKPAVEYALFDARGALHQNSDDTGFWVWLMLHRHLG
ncbi:MAG: hypothetical protein ACE361_23720 [Aureliella sp.]